MPTRKYLRKLKDLVYGAKSHDILVFCFFLAVSFAFWLLQASGEILERETTVNLRLDSIPPDVVIIDSLPSTLSVTIEDRGLALTRHSISAFFKSDEVSVDFAKYDTGLNDAEVEIPFADIQRLLAGSFPASTKIVSIRPNTLHFSYNHGLSRTLPVKLLGTIKASRQNYIQSISLKPDSVKVFAPAAVLDTMQAAYTQAFTLDGLEKSETYLMGLCKHNFLKYDPQQVEINVKVGYYTEKTVKVPIIGQNFPEDKRLRTFPAEASVTFRVESGRFHKINTSDFMLAVTYEELQDNKENSKLLLNLTTAPEGISDVKISPQEVDYLIEQVVVEEFEP